MTDVATKSLVAAFAPYPVLRGRFARLAHWWLAGKTSGQVS
jgi:hypothetical protein